MCWLCECVVGVFRGAGQRDIRTDALRMTAKRTRLAATKMTGIATSHACHRPTAVHERLTRQQTRRRADEHGDELRPRGCCACRARKPSHSRGWCGVKGPRREDSGLWPCHHCTGQRLGWDRPGRARCGQVMGVGAGMESAGRGVGMPRTEVI